MNDVTGTLLDIAVRSASRAEMVTMTQAQVTCEHGIEQDFRGRPRRRQVTVLSQEAWDAACDDLSATLAWTTRRANLLVKGIDLRHSAGKTLRVGDAVLRITGETDPCDRMEEAHGGLYEALRPDWRGGHAGANQRGRCGGGVGGGKGEVENGK